MGAQVLLFENLFNSTAFGNASNGVATANAIGNDSSANATCRSGMVRRPRSQRHRYRRWAAP